MATLTLAVLLPSCGQAKTAGTNAALVLERTIPLEQVAGRIDHLAADVTHRRIIVAELGNGSVDVIDLATGVSRRISGLHEPQGVGYLPERNELVVASGGDGTVRFYNGTTLTEIGLVKLGKDADNVRLAPVSGEVVVGYGGGGLAFIDPARRMVTRTIALPAHPESFRIDQAAMRLFVNLPNARNIAVVDARGGKLSALWKADHLMNFPMALDTGSGELATVYRWPARLDLVDELTGKVRQEVSTCGDADDVFYDLKRHRIYVSCGSGGVDVLQKAADRYHRLAETTTRHGARTALFVPELDRLFVAAPAGARSSPAVLMVFRPAN